MEFMMEQGMAFYFFGSVGVLGAAVSAAANKTYKRLIKEADAMEKSEHRLIKYIKLKYSSYYTLGLKANDEQAMIKRYLYRYRIGPMTLVAWSKMGLAALGAVILACLGNVLYKLGSGMAVMQMLPTVILAAFVAFALGMQYKLYGFDEKREIFCAQMEDNLQNFLKNKIEYGHTLEEKAEAAASQKAADSDFAEEKRTFQKKEYDDGRRMAAKKKSSVSAEKKTEKQLQSEDIYGKAAAALADGFGAEEIDARIVEDILKEFLN